MSSAVEPPTPPAKPNPTGSNPTGSNPTETNPPRSIPAGATPARLTSLEDPPIVVFRHEYKDPLEHLWSRLFATLSEPAYGAQRVFDLFTLMAITLAFGLMFAAMKALGAIPEVFFGVTAFVTFVAIGQMLLFSGNSPRLASMVGGPMALALTVSCLSIWYGNWQIWTILCTLPFGVPAGYLAGGMAAGVFLIADELRAKFTRPRAEPLGNFWEDES